MRTSLGAKTSRTATPCIFPCSVDKPPTVWDYLPHWQQHWVCLSSQESTQVMVTVCKRIPGIVHCMKSAQNTPPQPQRSSWYEDHGNDTSVPRRVPSEVTQATRTRQSQTSDLISWMLGAYVDFEARSLILQWGNWRPGNFEVLNEQKQG